MKTRFYCKVLNVSSGESLEVDHDDLLEIERKKFQCLADSYQNKSEAWAWKSKKYDDADAEAKKIKISNLIFRYESRDTRKSLSLSLLKISLN